MIKDVRCVCVAAFWKGFKILLLNLLTVKPENITMSHLLYINYTMKDEITYDTGVAMFKYLNNFFS